MFASQTIHIYLAIAGSVLLFAGVAIAILKWGLKKNAEHAWHAYRGWLIMIPLVIGAILLGRIATIVFFGLIAIVGFTEFASQHLPLDRPFAMVANHASHLDAVTLLSALPLMRIQKAYPAAAKDYFFTSMPKIAFSAVVMNAMPFDRKENPRDSLALCRELLETPGHVLIIFPEGTRSTNGEIAAFKPGIGFLTAGTNIAVVPCFLDGAYRAWPKGALVPRPRKLTLRIGEPMTFSDPTADKEGAKIVAARLRESVFALSSRASSEGPGRTGGTIS